MVRWLVALAVVRLERIRLGNVHIHTQVNRASNRVNAELLHSDYTLA